MKSAIKALLKAGVRRLPWGANEALLEALRVKMGSEEILARCAPDLEYLHLCADGDYGLMQSSLRDGLILPTYARTGTYDPELVGLFRDFFAIKAGGTYFDIGANIGLTTVPIAQDGRVKCLAFEPAPSNYACLQKNVVRNCPHGNVETFQAALYSSHEELSFSLSEVNVGDHRLDPAKRDHGGTLKVKAIPLDDFVNDVRGAIAIKMDTQGAEPFVIAGGRRVLALASLVVLEFSPFHIKALNGDAAILIDLLQDFPLLAIRSKADSRHSGFRPAREVLDFVKDKLASWRDRDMEYWDIFASREASR